MNRRHRFPVRRPPHAASAGSASRRSGTRLLLGDCLDDRHIGSGNIGRDNSHDANLGLENIPRSHSKPTHALGNTFPVPTRCTRDFYDAYALDERAITSAIPLVVRIFYLVPWRFPTGKFTSENTNLPLSGLSISQLNLAQYPWLTRPVSSRSY